jgi:hypothetical protein
MGPLLPILLSKGVDVNHKAGCGSTALHLAAATGSLLIVQSLLENGADPEALDASGYKPAGTCFLDVLLFEEQWMFTFLVSC